MTTATRVPLSRAVPMMRSSASQFGWKPSIRSTGACAICAFRKGDMVPPSVRSPVGCSPSKASRMV